VVAYSVAEPVRHESAPVKGSRFVASVRPVGSEAEARAFHTSVAAEMPDASHHCWAWRIAAPVIDRAGDDGEPGGSAGRPILAQLSGRDLVDTAVVVSRWFGGTKLGVGGLVRAYGGAAGEALDSCRIIPWIHHVTVLVAHGHGDTSAVERAVGSVEATITDTAWAAEVIRTVAVADSRQPELWAALADATNGRVTPPDVF
jgi:uncharacterized YigZ family protein